ncbi:RecB family exonuclease [Solicola sp. PLA-1-18]|uniref:RecB family exonuclease n=1 Tax=Solicola sp. PLA-1-18 TaxID=3380532 RepID=UPI003B7DDE4E
MTTQAHATDPETGRTLVDGVDVVGSLSPSRAADFMACPLKYRFRTIDRLPETPSAAAVRGTVVHAVLERLFDRPAPERTPDVAVGLLPAAWESVLAAEPGLAALFEGDEPPVADRAAWLEECAGLVRRWFELEDPTRLEPADRELYVEHVIDSRLLLRGYVDRLDVAATGEVRVVDYKTGRAPSEQWEASALFQMRFYALVLWRSTGRVPTLLQLVYLGSGEVLTHAPDEADLLATERKVEALWTAIDLARTTGDFQPNRGRICSWCDHRALCPAWGGTPPPLPTVELSVPHRPIGP